MGKPVAPFLFKGDKMECAIKAYHVLPGDRVEVKAMGRRTTRTVQAVGEGFVVINLCGQVVKIPEHQITSHVRG
jgi:hypothetical protein